jgi:hypothetical protein
MGHALTTTTTGGPLVKTFMQSSGGGCLRAAKAPPRCVSLCFRRNLWNFRTLLFVASGTVGQ